MISPEYARTMARYNEWMNGRLYDASAKLSDEARKEDMGAFFKSIHGSPTPCSRASFPTPVS
jgi:uncharacterized damage-inducible protein DinB